MATTLSALIAYYYIKIDIVNGYIVISSHVWLYGVFTKQNVSHFIVHYLSFCSEETIALILFCTHYMYELQSGCVKWFSAHFKLYFFITSFNLEQTGCGNHRMYHGPKQVWSFCNPCLLKAARNDSSDMPNSKGYWLICHRINRWYCLVVDPKHRRTNGKKWCSQKKERDFCKWRQFIVSLFVKLCKLQIKNLSHIFKRNVV